ARVRRGEPGARRSRRPDRRPSHPPEPRFDARHPDEHRALLGDSHGSVPLLPRALRAAADAVMGRDAERGSPEPRARPPSRRVPGARHHAGRARVQPPRRRPSRRTRPSPAFVTRRRVTSRPRSGSAGQPGHASARPPPLRIRAARRDALDALAALMAASPLLWRYGTTRRAAVRALARGMRSGDRVIVATSLDGQLVGLAWILPSRILTGAAYLRLLLVAEEHQRAGSGARLLA